MFLTVLFFLSAVVFSQTITVTSPHAGDTWYKGDTKIITWTSTDIPASTNMKINIFKDAIDPANFVEQLLSTNDHSESWPIGAGYVTGTYYIRIKTEDSATHGDSEAFTIKSCAVVVGPGRIPRLSMSLAELAVFMHGPGPRIRELSQIRSILEKNNIKNYIGGNSFLEMGFAHILNKKIFILNDIPEMIYTDEIEAMQPIALRGDLTKIN